MKTKKDTTVSTSDWLPGPDPAEESQALTETERQGSGARRMTMNFHFQNRLTHRDASLCIRLFDFWGCNGFDVIRSSATASACWSVGTLKSRPYHSRQCRNESCGLTVAENRLTPIGRILVASGKAVSCFRLKSKWWRRLNRRPDETARSLSRDTLVDVALALFADGGSTPPSSTIFESNGSVIHPATPEKSES